MPSKSWRSCRSRSLARTRFRTRGSDWTDGGHAPRLNLPMARLTSCTDLITFVLAACLESRSTRRAEAPPVQVSDSFDASHNSAASTLDFVTRVVENTSASACVFVTALIYMQRLGDWSPQYATTVKNLQNVFLAAVVLAIKFHDDLFYSNSYYASLGGISVEELNKNELLFLSAIDYKLYVSDTEFVFAEHTIVTEACESCMGPTLAPHLERAGMWIPQSSRAITKQSFASFETPCISGVCGNSPFASTYFSRVSQRLASLSASDTGLSGQAYGPADLHEMLMTPPATFAPALSVPAFNSFDGVYLAPCADTEQPDTEDEEVYECHAVRMLDLEYCAMQAF